MIAWVDVETTGLEPRGNVLLEVGIILTDDALNEIDRTSVTITPPATIRLIMKPEVLEMHDSGIGNGLLAECFDKGLEREDAMFTLIRWLNDRVEEPPIMAGSTVDFDRYWLKAKMSLLEQQFHYRSINVSSLKEINVRWGFADEWNNDRKTHRALDDLEDSIAELRHYSAALNIGPQAVVE